MVDRDPLAFWTAGRVTLLGDAAHPMVPRGSNGAGQAILDAQTLAAALAQDSSPSSALKSYENKRLSVTSRVVLENRSNPPDAILREVYERTGDRPFRSIEDVISTQELAALSERYKQVAGYDRVTLQGGAQRLASRVTTPPPSCPMPWSMATRCTSPAWSRRISTRT
jgi:2-polyprenyl-6-methoxyphenol hydroxylase-like FAD-dependent oxidoreductase